MTKLIRSLTVLAVLISNPAAFGAETANGGGLLDAVAGALRGNNRGQAFESNERGGRRRNGNLISVNGCSANSKFKTYYGTPGSGRKGRGPACDKNLTMNRHYVDFANRNMEVCAQRAADNAYGAGKISAVQGDNAIYHHGCMGDANHQHTGSWHNEGMAWDVTAIKLGGTVLKYAAAKKDRKVASFFEHFRKCWGEKVAANGKSCRKSGRKGRPAGTIGNEDRRHQHHLHLSLPCKALSNGRATFTAGYEFFELLFPVANADEMDDDPEMERPEGESQFFTSQLKVDKGVVEVEVEDAVEPVNADTMISLTLACNKTEDIVNLEQGLPSCAFDGLRPGPNGQVVLNYREAKLVDGVLSCSVPKTKQYQVSCL